MSRQKHKKHKGSVRVDHAHAHNASLYHVPLEVCVLLFSLLFLLGYLYLSHLDKTKTKDFNLIQPQYEPIEPGRKAEIDFVKKKNSAMFGHVAFPNTRNMSKLLTYCKPDKINIIANADILFDYTILLAKTIQDGQVYALTRHEMDGHFNRPDSQDVWIFNGLPRDSLPEDLLLGKPGVDNRLAFEFVRVGYQISNPSKSIFTWHIHQSNKREYTAKDVVPPPYAIVHPILLQEIRSNESTKLETFIHGFTREQIEKMQIQR